MYQDSISKWSTSALTARKRLPKVSGLFLLTVIIPTALAIIYFGFIASDVYVS